MKRSPLALALVTALGIGVALPSAPAVAQQAVPVTTASIRTGSSSVPGPLGVRLAVYDRTSYELFWNRIPNATAYRLQIGSGTVQQGGATSRYISNVDLSGGFDYTLTALDRAGTTLVTQRFRVQPASATQLVAAGGGTTAPTNPMAPVTPTNPATGPIRTGTTRVGQLFPVSLSVYDARSYELAWARVPGAVLYRLFSRSTLLQEGTGISRYFGSVDTSASTDYTIVSLDRDGDTLLISNITVAPRATAQLTLRGELDAMDPSNAPTRPGTVAPTPPTVNDGPIRTGQTSLAGDIAVRLAVYDRTSYELFWDRVPGAVRYRLSRGGSVVQESDAVSRFVGNADSTQRFDYTLAALDRSGNVLRTRAFAVAPRGTPQLVAAGGGTGTPSTPTTPVTPPASTGGLSRAEAIDLDRLLALVNGDAVEKLTAFALRVRPGAATLVATGRTGSVTIPGVDANLATAEYRCRDGGTATVVDPNAFRTIVTYTGCRVGPLTASGRAESSLRPANATNRGPIPPPFAGTVPFEMQLRDDFTLSDARDGSAISVRTVDAYERAELGGTTARFTTFWGASELRVTGPGGTVTSARPQGEVAYLGTPGVADGQPFFVVQAIPSGFDATFSGSLGAVSVATPTSFERDRAAGNFPNGTLAVTGPNVSYGLDAGNGDPATFQLNITRDGSTAAYTVPWSDRFELEPFSPDRVELGF